jgi:hypothetical protein
MGWSQLRMGMDLYLFSSVIIAVVTSTPISLVVRLYRRRTSIPNDRCHRPCPGPRHRPFMPSRPISSSPCLSHREVQRAVVAAVVSHRRHSLSLVQLVCRGGPWCFLPSCQVNRACSVFLNRARRLPRGRLTSPASARKTDLASARFNWP